MAPCRTLRSESGEMCELLHTSLVVQKMQGDIELAIVWVRMCRTLPASRAARRVSPPPHRPRVSRRHSSVRPDTDLLKLETLTMLEGLQEPARVRQVLHGLRLLLVPQAPPVGYGASQPPWSR